MQSLRGLLKLRISDFYADTFLGLGHNNNNNIVKINRWWWWCLYLSVCDAVTKRHYPTAKESEVLNK